MEETPDQRRERIFKAEDTNTCFHCGEPIKPGEPRYTINHSHYACHEKFHGGRTPSVGTESLAELRQRVIELDRRIADLKTRKLT